MSLSIYLLLCLICTFGIWSFFNFLIVFQNSPFSFSNILKIAVFAKNHYKFLCFISRKLFSYILIRELHIYNYILQKL